MAHRGCGRPVRRSRLRVHVGQENAKVHQESRGDPKALVGGLWGLPEPGGGFQCLKNALFLPEAAFGECKTSSAATTASCRLGSAIRAALAPTPPIAIMTDTPKRSRSCLILPASAIDRS